MRKDEFAYVQDYEAIFKTAGNVFKIISFILVLLTVSYILKYAIYSKEIEFSVQSVVMAHRTGVVLPQEPIVCIHVGSAHRAEGFEACSWLISELKSQAPLWKKEVRADGEIWKAGLG